MLHASRETAKSKLSESEFLRLEAEKAKAEISCSLQRAKAALGHNVDPRELTRRHPWMAIASAVVAGFVAATVAIPSKEQQELRHLERLHRAMNPPPAASPEAETNGNAKRPDEKQSIASTILHEVIQLLRPILLTAIAASIKSGTTPPPPAAPSPAGPQGPDKSV